MPRRRRCSSSTRNLAQGFHLRNGMPRNSWYVRHLEHTHPRVFGFMARPQNAQQATSPASLTSIDGSTVGFMVSWPSKPVVCTRPQRPARRGASRQGPMATASAVIGLLASLLHFGYSAFRVLLATRGLGVGRRTNSLRRDMPAIGLQCLHYLLNASMVAAPVFVSGSHNGDDDKPTCPRGQKRKEDNQEIHLASNPLCVTTCTTPCFVSLVPSANVPSLTPASTSSALSL